MGPDSISRLDQTLEKEYQRGKKIRERRGKTEHPNLKMNLKKRWDATRHFHELPEEDQNGIIDSIIDQIEIHRELFDNILGGNASADETIERLIRRELPPSAITVMVNQYLDQYLDGKPDQEKIHVEKIVALLTRNLAEQLRLTVEKDKKQRILDVDRAGLDVDEKEFGVKKTSINGIIENSTENVEYTLRKILSFLKKYVFAGKAKNVSFSLANENNDYGEAKHFTYIDPEMEILKSDKDPLPLAAEVVANEPFYDPKTRCVYLKIVNQDRFIGTLTVELKNNMEFDDHDIEMIKQIGSRIDTYSDLKISKLRIEKVIEKGEEILEENKSSVDFENGVKEIALLACRNSRAKQAIVIYKKPGLVEKIVAQIYSKDGSVEKLDLEPHLAKLLCEREAKHISHDYMKAGKIVDEETKAENLMPSDLVDISKPNHPTIGKIMLVNDEDCRVLSDEDKEMLDQMGGLIDTHIARRKMNLTLLSIGRGQKVAEALSNDELLTNSREKMTMFFVDITAWTEKCQKLSQLGHGDKIFRLAEIFLGKVDEIGKKYGGEWCNDVGDCGILLFGPPYYKNGKDGLGLTKDSKDREAIHAMNALKTYMAIQNATPEMNAEYAKMLTEVAEDIYSHNQTSMDKRTTSVLNDEDRKKYFLEKLGREHQLKPNIGVTTGIYSGEVNVGILNLPSSQRYTVLDDAMNMAARYQTAALESEALCPLSTKNYIEEMIENDKPVPYNDNGEMQTWSEFLEEDLGVNTSREEAGVGFIEEYFEMKSTRGMNLGYRVQFKRKPAGSKTEKMRNDHVLNEQELLALEGEYAVISENTHDAENTIILTLRTLSKQPVEFRAKVAQGKITKSEKKRMVSEQEALRRGNCDEDHILVVKDYHLQTYRYESMEKKLSAKLEELTSPPRLLNDDEVPVGLYVVMNAEPDKNNSDYMIYSLFNRDGKGIRARIPMERVKDRKECICIKKNADLHKRFSAHHFAFKNSEIGKHAWIKEKELIYIQGSHYYTIPLTGLEEEVA